MILEMTPGCRYALGDQLVEIDGARSMSTVAVRNVATGATSIASTETLRPAGSRPLAEASPNVIPEVQWRRAVAAAIRLRPLVPLRKVPKDTLIGVARELGISARTVQRRLTTLRRSEQTSDLVPLPGGRRPGSKHLDPDVEAIVAEQIEAHWLVREPMAFEDLYDRVLIALEAINKRLSRNALRRRLAALDAAHVLKRKRGRKSAKQQYEGRPGGLVVSRPLELVQIDHTPVDLILVSDDALREPVGRPWLTIVIDVATRVVLGFYVSFDAPSATSVALALEHAVFPKEGWLKACGVDALWPMYGRPLAVLVDNGKDFHSVALTRGCEQYGITLQYRPVKTPHFGAHIERLIGTFMRRVHRLPGTTFSNTKERGDYPSEARASMTLREFRAWLVNEITTWYHTRAHRTLGRSPSTAWTEGHTVSGVLTPPAVIGDAVRFRVGFLPRKRRAVTRSGIELHGVHYWHDALESLVGRGEPVDACYDPRDVRQIYVELPDHAGLVVVPEAAAALPALSLTEHRQQRAAERERVRTAEKELESVRLRGAGHSDALVRAARSATCLARRKPKADSATVVVVTDPAQAPHRAAAPARTRSTPKDLCAPPPSVTSFAVDAWA
ncbi:Mu transposase C-terminal domain-containing protein [Ahniella affigens]|nr:Mu transposase C-terminal domain-containing protein [Ahniella affigens]